ncbi:MAG: tRNA 2-thiouridine(34) synthase MnmA, partial [Candidatus Omnitrophota bacterium]
ASHLRIPFYLLNFETLFQEKVVDYFVSEYAQGRTPNPCIPCNDHVKFGGLLRKAEEMDCSYVATGHYARLEYHPGEKRFLLKAAKDANKDQSYVLFGLTQERLAHLFFPLGEMTKEEVRRYALESGLSVAKKAESQDACFLQEKDYRTYLDEHGVQGREGEIVDRTGKVLGRHPGIHAFTVGQRSGLGIALGAPAYVTAIDVERNRLIVGTRDDLARREIWVDRVNWVSDILEDGQTRKLFVKIRYRHPKATAEVKRQGDSCLICLEEPAYAVTPGQACVFYDDDIVLGGGWIR